MYFVKAKELINQLQKLDPEEKIFSIGISYNNSEENLEFYDKYGDPILKIKKDREE